MWNVSALSVHHRRLRMSPNRFLSRRNYPERPCGGEDNSGGEDVGRRGKAPGSTDATFSSPRQRECAKLVDCGRDPRSLSPFTMSGRILEATPAPVRAPCRLSLLVANQIDPNAVFRIFLCAGRCQRERFARIVPWLAVACLIPAPGLSSQINDLFVPQLPIQFLDALPGELVVVHELQQLRVRQAVLLATVAGADTQLVGRGCRYDQSLVPELRDRAVQSFVHTSDYIGRNPSPSPCRPSLT